MPKVGKTTFASQLPKPLLLAFEKGYNSLPGIVAQDITSWGEFKSVVRELKKPEVKQRFSSIILDTIDVASSLCDRYICSQLGVDSLGDGGWTTNGWSKYKKEMEDAFRTITQLGYALVFISHSSDKTFKRQDGSEYNQIVPTVQKSANNIAKDMADIYAYAGFDPITKERKLFLRSLDDSIDCGCRFKYIEPVIDFNYDSLVKAMNAAIDKEAAEMNGVYVTEEREVAPILKTYDYDELMKEFQSITNELMKKDSSNQVKITAIVDKILGKGKKASDATPDQAEFLYLIIEELKEL